MDELRQRAAREMRGKLMETTMLDASTPLSEIGISSLQVVEIVYGLEEDLGVAALGLERAPSWRVDDDLEAVRPLGARCEVKR